MPPFQTLIPPERPRATSWIYSVSSPLLPTKRILFLDKRLAADLVQQSLLTHSSLQVAIRIISYNLGVLRMTLLILFINKTEAYYCISYYEATARSIG